VHLGVVPGFVCVCVCVCVCVVWVYQRTWEIDRREKRTDTVREREREKERREDRGTIEKWGRLKVLAKGTIWSLLQFLEAWTNMNRQPFFPSILFLAFSTQTHRVCVCLCVCVCVCVCWVYMCMCVCACMTVGYITVCVEERERERESRERGTETETSQLNCSKKTNLCFCSFARWKEAVRSQCALLAELLTLFGKGSVVWEQMRAEREKERVISRSFLGLVFHYFCLFVSLPYFFFLSSPFFSFLPFFKKILGMTFHRMKACTMTRYLSLSLFLSLSLGVSNIYSAASTFCRFLSLRKSIFFSGRFFSSFFHVLGLPFHAEECRHIHITVKHRYSEQSSALSRHTLHNTYTFSARSLTLRHYQAYKMHPPLTNPTHKHTHKQTNKHAHTQHKQTNTHTHNTNKQTRTHTTHTHHTHTHTHTHTQRERERDICTSFAKVYLRCVGRGWPYVPNGIWVSSEVYPQPGIYLCLLSSLRSLYLSLSLFLLHSLSHTLFLLFLFLFFFFLRNKDCRKRRKWKGVAIP